MTVSDKRREEILEAYSKLVRTIGTGFHPDTPFDGYEPPITMYTRREFEWILDDIFSLLDVDPYAIGLSICYELSNEE